MQTLSKIVRATGLAATMVCLWGSVADAATLTVVWDRNTEAAVVGYKLSWGNASQDYSTTIDVGNAVSYVFDADPTLHYYFAVQAYTADGELSPYSTEISFPDSMPTVSITAPVDGITVSGLIPVTASASDDVGVVGVQFTLDGTALGAEDTTAPYSVSWNTAVVAIGSHTLTAIARDATGNLTSSAPVTVIVTVIVDVTPPVISGATPSSITASGATLTWTTNETSDSQVDYGLTTAYGSTSALNAALVTAHAMSLAGLTGATLYHVRVRSRDAAGNLAVSGDVTLTTLDGSAPLVSITAPTGGTTVSGSIQVTASASDDVGVAGVQFMLDSALLSAEDTTAPYSVPWNTAAAAAGTYTLTAIARDAAGNRTTSAPVTVTVNDTTPPVISGVVSSSITASGATLTWTTNETSDSQVDYGLTTAYGSTSVLNAALVTAHAMSLAGLTGATLYHVRVRSRDAAGNLAVSGDVTLTTLDGSAPLVSITAPTGGTTVSGSIQVTASASDDVGVAGVQFMLDSALLSAEDTTAPYSVPWNTAGASTGSHTLTAIARDAAGNRTTSAPVTVTVNDTTPPVISGVVSSSITASGAILTWTTNETSDSQVDYGLTTAYGSTSVLNAALVTAHAMSLAGLTGATLYHVRVRSRDAAGNLAVSGDVTLTTLDGSAPLVSITAPTGGTTVSGSIQVTASASDDVGVAGVQFMLDGATSLSAEDTTAPYSVSWDTAAAAAGTHTLTAIARDAAGNRTTSAPVTVTVNDVTPPVISGATPSSITASGATLTWTTNETSDSQVDYGLTTAYGSTSPLNPALVTAHTVNLTGLTTATLYHVRVRSRDAAGNLAVSGDITLTTLDGTAPIVSITAPAGGSTVSGTISVTATASDDVAVVGVQFALDGATSLGGEDTTAPYSVSWNTAGASTGSHTLTAIARDAAGNRTTSAPVTVTVNNDVTPPVISGVTSSSITTSAATVTWTTNEASDSQVNYGLTTAYGSTSTLNAALVTAHSVTLTGLTAATLYHVRVRSRDGAGNLALSGDVTLTTLDGTAPVVSITSPSGGTTVSGTITVRASASDGVGVVGVQFMLDGAALGAEDSTSPYSVSWNTAGTSTGSHTLAAIARDAAGNSTTSAGVTVSVNNDATPPVISGVTSSSITASSATITWTTNEASDSQVNYGLTTAYGSTSLLNTALVTAHSISLTGLTGATLYHVRVRSRDAVGNLAVSGDVTLTTLDGTAPIVSITAPAGGTTVSGTITVTATVSGSSGVVGVQFALDGATSLGGEDTTSPYSVSWNTAGAATGNHTLTAVARDGAGNRTTSAPVTVIVNNDVTPPVISAVTPSSITPSGAILTWTTNEASDSQVDYGLTTAYGSTSALNAALVTAHAMSLTGLTGATLYHVRVRSRDAAGNLAVSGDVTLTTRDGTAPFVSITAPAGGTTVSGTISVTASVSDNVQVVGVQFTLDGAVLGAEDTTSPYSVSWNTDGATIGNHTLAAIARDGEGNQATSDAVIVTVNNDTAPPVISGVTVSFLLSSGVTIAWTTDELSDSDVEYGLTTAYGSTSVLDPALVTAHTVTLSGLTGAALYHVRVRSRDAAGHLAVSDDVIVRRPVTGDYDGDGKADLSVYRPTIGTWFTRHSSTDYGTASSFQWGLDGDIPVPGDFDGDGKMDLTVHRPASGVWYIRQSATNYGTAVEFQWGLPGDIPVPGDYDGDGKTDLAVYRPASGEWYIRPSTTNYATFVVFQWGLPGDIPVPGDYDGDGKIELAVYRPPSGVWYIRPSTTNYATSLEFQWGLPGDIPVPGDFDADGQTDLAVWRPSSGLWFIRQSTTGYAASVMIQWGLPEDIPVVGDFDGDGMSDLAVYRPSIGTWFLRLSSTAFTVSTSFQWGLPGDVPILGRP